MSRSRVLVALTVLTASALTWGNWSPPASASSPFETAKVQLYSNGQVVGEWEAVGAGRVEGDTFVFAVRKGVQDVEVRIRGTFSYEVQP